MSGMNSKPGPSKNGGKQALVPPLLRDVGKLAAGVASVSTTTGGSATGNSRNKYALQPGHSLMDWIRLGASGKDLTGVGSQAGHLSVTPNELALHNTNTDAWLCIRGRVYNVTAYLPFHPGGPDELMRAVGKDATKLFEDVHPWVNYEQILNKCYVGHMHTQCIEEVFGRPSDSSLKLVESVSSESREIHNDDYEEIQDANSTQQGAKEPTILLPKFDWIQKLEYITLIFYTGNFSNPLIEINQIHKELINITLNYQNQLFENEVNFFKEVLWPCQIKTVSETGKVEFVFKKSQAEIWENYGVLKQTTKSEELLTQPKFKCTVINKAKVNHNTFLLKLERNDKNKIVVPIGKHIRAFDTVKGEEVSRSYTPVPSCLFDKFSSQPHATTNICLLVKRYPDGNLSRLLADSQIGDAVTVSRPLGAFNLSDLEKRETFIVLAAGTGITPMFSLVLFLLERRIRKCQQLRLLFFNKTEPDVLFRSQFDELARDEKRFRVVYVLSQPDKNWTGLRGHVSEEIVRDTVGEHLTGTTYTKKDVFWMVCGPSVFTNLSRDILNRLEFGDDQIHLFLG